MGEAPVRRRGDGAAAVERAAQAASQGGGGQVPSRPPSDLGGPRWAACTQPTTPAQKAHWISRYHRFRKLALFSQL